MYVCYLRVYVLIHGNGIFGSTKCAEFLDQLWKHSVPLCTYFSYLRSTNNGSKQ
jgi:hypothetical protein